MTKLGKYLSFVFVVWNVYGSQAKVLDAHQSESALQDTSNPFLTNIMQLQNDNEKRISGLEDKIEKQEFIINRINRMMWGRIEEIPSPRYDEEETPKFEEIGSRRFYISHRRYPVPRPAAEETCRRMGGYLAAIKDQEELDAIKAKVNRHVRYWLGINDRDNNGTYVSQASGKVAPFLKWRAGEPNNKKGDEHCVELLDGVMNDVPCSTALFTICQEDNNV